jgi:hypothetical protein
MSVDEPVHEIRRHRVFPPYGEHLRKHNEGRVTGMSLVPVGIEKAAISASTDLPVAGWW